MHLCIVTISLAQHEQHEQHETGISMAGRLACQRVHLHGYAGAAELPALSSAGGVAYAARGCCPALAMPPAAARGRQRCHLHERQELFVLCSQTKKTTLICLLP